MEAIGDALIGYTGFVGSNILMQRDFDFLYNSRNIADIQGKTFKLCVCAGAPGTKWIANQNPEADLATIEKLIDNLKTIKCERLILISTIDVYSPVNEVTEDSEIIIQNLQPYGRHRRLLEEFVAKNFDSLILRLPGIFGTGLKKNVIFDLQHGLPINISPESKLQFYWLNHLWGDINKALQNKLKKINLATEPFLLKQLASEIFAINLPSSQITPAVNYNMQTKYGQLWGSQSAYLYSKKDVLADLIKFIGLTK